MGATVAKQDYRIVDALNADWDQLKGSCHDAVKRWSHASPGLAGCARLEDVLAAVRTDPDGVLAVLLADNARGEQLAGRVVLQAMLGKVVRMASRDVQASVDDYVVGMWCRIQTYPLHKRAVSIAANLALDTLKTVVKERVGVRAGISVVPVHEEGMLDQYQSEARIREELDHSPVARLSATSVIATAGQMGLINEQTRDVMLSVYCDGLTGGAAARRHHTTADMIRYRCSRGVRRMARDTARLAMAA